MTREAFYKKIQSNQRVNNSTRSWAENLVNEVIADFESRTCENCKFLVDGSCTLGIRHFEIDTNPEDFGCNKFKPKDD